MALDDGFCPEQRPNVRTSLGRYISPAIQGSDAARKRAWRRGREATQGISQDNMQYQPAELENYPGYHIRRLQQIAVAVFMEEVDAFGVTPVQYASLSAVLRQPGIDQRTLARSIGFDTSTIGSVIDRLEARGLMVRNASPADRRVRLLTLTEEGRQLLQQAEPAVLRAQRRMLDPLPDDKRAQFMEMISLLIHENDEFARAPSAVAERSAERKRTAAVKAVKALAGKNKAAAE